MPFSFGDSIYLNKNSHTDKELEEIIMHEYVHVKQRHSVDILIAELLCIVNWYNPFSWFMRHSIRQNLEFIADDNVVRSGINKKDYQYHLLKVVGIPQYRIANQFNFSSLKKRIIMMNRQKSAKIQLLKFMFILPLLAVTLLAFRSEIANAMVKVKNMPQAMHFINKIYQATPKPAQVTTIKTKETPEPVKPKDGGQFRFSASDSIVVDKPKRVTTLFGDAKLSNATGGISAPIIMLDDNKDNGGVDFKNALVQVDGRNTDMDAIDQHAIASVNALRSKNAVALFGEKARYGALLYVTRQPDIVHNKTADVTAFSAGEVLATKKVSGTSLIIVKRGEFFDAYSNLTSVNVKKGDKVNQGEVIGKADVDETGKPTLVYELYKGSTFITKDYANDTTIYSALTIKGNGTVNSSSDIHSAKGLTGIASNGSGSGNISVSLQPGDARALTTASSGNGSKAVTFLAGNVRYVTISNDPNELTFTIDPQHVDESKFESIKKRFADSGFDLKIKAEVKQGKARKLNISIYGSQKDNSSSAVYTANDITDKDKFIIKIEANKKTGSVSINTFSDTDAPN
jgi:hypothetical protein